MERIISSSSLRFLLLPLCYLILTTPCLVLCSQRIISSSVWSYVPFIDLDDSSLFCPDLIKDQAMQSSFVRFLNNVFNLHEAGSLQKLTLKCSKFDSRRVNEWVMSAMRCMVKELDLWISMKWRFQLGVPLFVYQDLVALKLGREFVLRIPGEVLLPSLKKLHLDSIEFSDDESCLKLFSGRPVLEHLHIEECDMGNVKTLQIIAPALKFLCYDGSTKLHEHQVIVDAPCLEVLRFVYCFLAESYSFKNVGSLTDTHINVHMNRIHWTKIDDVRKSSIQLVEGIANAKVITFTSPTLEASPCAFYMDQKHKAMKKVKRSEDRISGLPDPILGHILSYLTTKESVRTSILSKRWLSVWSYVPFLDLDDTLLLHDEHNKEQALRSSFIQFLNNAFSLSRGKFDCNRVNEWVLSAMRCKVKELDLCINENRNFKLHVPLFVCQDLVSLKLGCDFVLDILGDVLLPCLKKLYLLRIKFSDEESCRKLFSGCPVLEYLHIVKCDIGNVKTLQIIAPALKFLVFDSQYGFVDEFHNLHVCVDAPFLEVLRWECFSLAKSYSFKNLGSLTHAYIDVFANYYVIKTSVIRKSSLQLIKGIAHAKTITLTDKTLKVLSFLDLNKLPLLNHLTKLELEGHSSCSKLLPKFLANSPFLQDLVLDVGNVLQCFMGL